eukprot:6729418-Alexandrium_andersonii.AAC.1
MSASLVGSEMCIRDRFFVVPAVAGLLRARRPDLRVHVVIENAYTTLPRHCLLYTSDAADDM